jgi:ribosomal protein S17E
MKKIPIILWAGLLFVAADGANAQAGMRVFANANLTVAGKMAVYGNVANDASAQAGGQLKIQDGAAIELHGNRWLNSVAATEIKGGVENTGTLSFESPSGNTPQQYLNGGAASFPSISIASNKPVQLEGNVAVRKQLSFGAGGGYLIAGEHNLNMAQDAVFAGFSTDRYVITNGRGLIIKEGLASNVAFVFPVGRTTNDYTPAMVEPLNGTASYSVGVQDFAASNIDLNLLRKGANIGRTWIVVANKPGAMASLGLVHYEKLGVNGYDGLKSTIANYTGNGQWNTAGLQAEANIVGLPANFWQQASNTAIGMEGSKGIYFTKVSVASKPMSEPIKQMASIVANPFTNLLQVKYEGNEQVAITVTSIEGKLVHVSGKIANGTTRINSAGWTPGIYQVVLRSAAGKNTSFKVMKM